MKIYSQKKWSKVTSSAKPASQQYIDALLRKYNLDLNNYSGNVGDHIDGWSFIEDKYGNWDFSDRNGYTAKVDSNGNVIASAKVNRRSRSIKASTTNQGIIDVLEANGFESAGIDEPWWDKNLWLGFGCTYNAERQDAYVWWNPDGNMVELPYEYSVKTVQDANALCDDLYNWDEYYIGELLEVGLPLKGATKVGDGQYEYSDRGETAFIDVNTDSGYVIDAYGDKTEYSSLQDLLEEIGIIR